MLEQIPEKVRAEIDQVQEPPEPLQGRDSFLSTSDWRRHVEANAARQRRWLLRTHLSSTPVATVGAESYADRFVALENAITSITTLLRESDRFQKPLLTMDEAAALLTVSVKRLTNIMYQERARLGRFPDWIVDGGGTIQRRVVRDGLLSWAKRRGKNVVRRRMVPEL